MSRTAEEIPFCNQAYCVYYGGFNTRCTKKQDENGDPCPRTLRAERDALRSALEWCAERVFQGCDIDGGDFQDEMVERGIMVSEPAPDEWKIEWDADKWFVLAWLARGGK